MFPASLSSKYRYILHEVVSQLFSDFKISTVSVGRDNRRRTCLFFTDVISQLKMSQSTETAVDVKASESSDSSESKAKASKKQKRPDKPLYVPPGSKSSKSSDSESTGSQSKPDKDKDKSCKENNEPSWDSLYDDSGDVIDNEFVKELNSELEIRAVRDQLTATTLDYSKFTTNEWSDESQPETGTVLEVYDFVSDLKTRDLIMSISSTNSKNFDIDWVDDTHCLVIFNSSAQASEALSKVYPNLKLRPISQGTKESQSKAQKRAESKLSKKPRPRPETTTLLARRLVAGALGIKADMDPEQRKAEREKLRLAKEKKQQVQKNVKNIWDGNVS